MTTNHSATIGGAGLFALALLVPLVAIFPAGVVAVALLLVAAHLPRWRDPLKAFVHEVKQES